jgi:hypothetical protein
MQRCLRRLGMLFRDDLGIMVTAQTSPLKNPPGIGWMWRGSTVNPWIEALSPASLQLTI